MAALAEGAVKVSAATVAKPFREEVQQMISKFGFQPKLVGFLANDDMGAKKYAEWTGRACAADGIDFELREVPMLELEERLHEANEDPAVHGIMIYYPCFGAFPSFSGGSMDDFLRDSISIEKDVEGLCHTYRTNLYRNRRFLSERDSGPGLGGTKKCILPCTPLAIVKILESDEVGAYDKALPKGDQMRGKVVTVINRSEIVGRPVAAMLANDGADVYSADIDSLYLFRRGKLLTTEETVETACKKSDVIITGVPTKDYRLNLDWVRPGAVVVNVSSYKNVDAAALLQIKGVKYVPLVGKVTVSMLERNLVTLVANFRDGAGKPRAGSMGAEAAEAAEAAEGKGE